MGADSRVQPQRLRGTRAIASSSRPPSRYRLGDRIVAQRVRRIGRAAASCRRRDLRRAPCAGSPRSSIGSSAAARGITCSHRSPISSDVFCPQTTRAGGWCGLRGLAGGVVVGVAHRDRRALRQRDRRGVAIHVLPAEIPVVDRDQPARACRRAASRLRLHPPREVVRVRLDGQHLDVHRQQVAIGDDVVARRPAGMSIVSLPRRRPTGVRVGGVVGEEEADASRRRAPACRSAAGAAARRDRCPARAATACRRAPDAAPGPASIRAAALPDSARRAPCCRRSPARDRARRAGATIACDRRRGSRGARRARCRDGIRSRGRTARAGDRNRDHEGAEHVGAVGRHRVRLRHADDEIGRAELPAVAPGRRRRQIARRRPPARRRRSIAAAAASSRSVSRALALELALSRHAASTAA